MDPNALYYALSTIAQCAAALAALIGFLGLWRLDRLREEYGQAERDVGWLLASAPVSEPRVTNITVHTLHRDIIIQAAEQFITKCRDSQDDTLRSFALKTEAILRRWRAIPGEQQRLLGVLQRFLRRTLVILALAIIGLVFASALNAWVVTALITRLLIILAGYRLWRDTYAVVREAARLPSTRLLLVVVLFLVSPALASETGQATSPPQRTLIRSAPPVNVYSYENAAGETVEEMENRQGKLIGRRFYRPAPLPCAYVRGVGLATQRYWRDDGDSIFRCVSPVNELGTVADPPGLGLKNALSYHVDGDAERIHKMLLHLNVNHRHEAKHAHQALVQAAKRLTQEALHTPLPNAAEQAIAAGKPWQGTVKTATLELVRDDWPTGKGYTLDFLVRPNQ